MLKIRTFILALSLTPLLSLNWQLPSQAQRSLSGGGAGGLSGGAAGGLSGGVAGGLSGGGAGGLSGAGNFILESRSSSLLIGRGNVFSLTPEALARLLEALKNLLARSRGILVALNGGGDGAIAASNDFQVTIIAAGVSEENATQLKENIKAIFTPEGRGRGPEGRGRGDKSLKSSLIIAQADAGEDLTIDINKLNDAIDGYNGIIDTSSPVTLQALSQNQDFVEIGNALRELRAAIN